VNGYVIVMIIMALAIVAVVIATADGDESQPPSGERHVRAEREQDDNGPASTRR